MNPNFHPFDKSRKVHNKYIEYWMEQSFIFYILHIFKNINQLAMAMVTATFPRAVVAVVTAVVS